MCWMVVKPQGKDIPEAYVEKAQSINKDGYGVIWFDNQVHNFKTMDFIEFKTKLATLTDFDAIIHLRYTSMGKTNIDNAHPFPIGNGAFLAHNGTMSGFRSCTVDGCSADDSDTKQLAAAISSCTWTRFSDIQPLVQQITGKVGNKLCIMESDGTITIVNKNLGIEEDGIWYSNEYHVTKTYTYGSGYYSKSFNTPSYNYNSTSKKTKVFVYGTLKKGFYNHHLLATAKFISEATTSNTYAMIGKDMSFPYVLGIRTKDQGGLHIKGEIYEVDEATLAQLDLLEGVPHLYKKQSVLLRTDFAKNSTVYETATMYVKTTPTQADFAKEFISEFTKPTLTLPASRKHKPDYSSFRMKSDAELIRMGQIELCFYLDELENLYYGKEFNTHYNYKLPTDELLDEIETLHDFILEDFQELMTAAEASPTPNLADFYSEYQDN